MWSRCPINLTCFSLFLVSLVQNQTFDEEKYDDDDDDDDDD